MRTLFCLILLNVSILGADPVALKPGEWKVLPIPAKAPAKYKWVVEPLSDVEGQVTLTKVVTPIHQVDKLDPNGTPTFFDAAVGSVIVVAKNPGKCRVALLVIGEDGFPDRLTSQVFAIEDGPGPNPPDPPVPPGPVPPPADGLHVLIVYDSLTLSKLTFSQQGILSAGSLRDYLDAKCPAGPDGKTKEYRIWDQSVDTTNVAKYWQDTMKLPRASVPWIYISNSKTSFSGPLPADTAATLELIQKYGGK